MHDINGYQKQYRTHSRNRRVGQQIKWITLSMACLVVIGLIWLVLHDKTIWKQFKSQARYSIDYLLHGDPQVRIATYLHKAESELADGHLEKSRIALQNLLLINPQHVEGNFLFGIIMEKKVEIARAIQAFIQAITVDPNHLPSLIKLAKYTYISNKFKLSDHLTKRILTLAPNHPEGELLQATLLTQSGQEKAALTAFQQGVNHHPQHPALQAGLAWLSTYLRKKHHIQRHLLQQITLHPTQSIYRQRLIALLITTNQLDKAQKSLTDALEIMPNQIGLIFFQALLYERENNQPQAIRTYEKILALQPENDLAINNLAILLTNNLLEERHKEKLLKLTQQLVTSQNPAILDTLGWIYLKLYRNTEAVTILQKAAELAPNNAIILSHLEMAHLRIKKINKINLF